MEPSGRNRWATRGVTNGLGDLAQRKRLVDERRHLADIGTPIVRASTRPRATMAIAESKVRAVIRRLFGGDSVATSREPAI